MANNRFQRGFLSAGGCYTCRCCGKKTRETGHDESSVELCAFCYEEAGLENSYSDKSEPVADIIAGLEALEVEYKRVSSVLAGIRKMEAEKAKEEAINAPVETDQMRLMRELLGE